MCKECLRSNQSTAKKMFRGFYGVTSLEGIYKDFYDKLPPLKMSLNEMEQVFALFCAFKHTGVAHVPSQYHGNIVKSMFLNMADKLPFRELLSLFVKDNASSNVEDDEELRELVADIEDLTEALSGEGDFTPVVLTVGLVEVPTASTSKPTKGSMKA